VAEVVPLLAVGGAGGLAWHRVRATALRTCARTREWQQHYRLQALQAVERESALCALLPRLRAVGVEPILIKGFASACSYPEPGLRPSSDIDLCVPAEQVDAAVAALAAAPLPWAVDLHADVPDLPGRPWHEVFRRSRLASLGEDAVRVLGPEDELRLLCLHQARHGLARPLWLCDVGALLESLPPTFDWDYCLSGTRPHADWTTCVVGLAERLLGARPAALPRPAAPPAWVEQAVLWCWGAGGLPLPHYLRHPDEVIRRWCYHGISPRHGSAPIKASFRLGLRPSRHLPLLVVQVAACFLRKLPAVCSRLLRPWPRWPPALTIHSH
jgi:hypothetical protein